jgi:hypothetical protein
VKINGTMKADWGIQTKKETLKGKNSWMRGAVLLLLAVIIIIIIIIIIVYLSADLTP